MTDAERTLSKLKPVEADGEDLLCTTLTALQLAETRVALNLKQQAVASEVGISQSYLHDLESGHRYLRMRMFNRIKDAMRKLSA